MADLPLQGLLQQMNAHKHGGEYLEVLGKQAAARWAAGAYKDLTAAVTETVKQAQLSPEQVKRVVEFTNTAAYLTDFKKEGAPHHVVDFPGGPADASVILQDLNDGGGGSVYDRGTGDYENPPSASKVSSTKAEDELCALFGKTASVETYAAESELPFENPHGEVINLKDKLAGAADHIQSEISGLEVSYAELGDRVFHQVKQAALSGVSLGEVMQAWETVAPTPEYVKVAFTLIAPRLLRDGVFSGVEAMTSSVDKTASAKMVNPEHPLVVEFGDFCTTLSKLAELRGARSEIRGHLQHLNGYLKTAAGGLVGEAYGALERGAHGVANGVAPFVGKALGPTAEKATHFALRHAPEAALALGASEAYTHMKHSQNPVARGARAAGNVVLRNVPGTQQNLQHKYEVESGQ